MARRQQLLVGLPPLAEVLRGSFFVRRRRCGNPRCHCAQGAGHRVALVGATFSDGSTEQVSLPRELEDLAHTWVRNYQRCWKTIERISVINREILRRRLVAPGR